MADDKLRNWASHIDEQTLEQAERTNRLPVVTQPLALMPDAHWGLGSTVGSVIPTENAIIPAAVGVDIGCGMCAVQTDISAGELPDTMQPLIGEFSRSVPSGVGRAHSRKSPRAEGWMADHPNTHAQEIGGNVAAPQLGTLGSGNHFLEVCLDEVAQVWVMLHSGSRGVGNKLAMSHIKLARALEQGLEDRDLAYFTEGTPEFRSYVTDMLWAQDYALENREIMMDAALNQVFRYVGKGKELRRVNCHHNYATQETHNGRLMWITRKGAIRAMDGDLGIIPGSMATGSYIVRGLGNPDSYQSASHGAGRKMSRNQAKKQLTVQSLEERMAGKAWNMENSTALLDEHPDAYKPIDDVMKDQVDLVTIEHQLQQILNYKGV